MSAPHIRPTHRPAPASPGHRAPLFDVPAPARCECGARATMTVTFNQFNSSGASFTNYLHVCPDCAAIMHQEDSGVMQIF